MSDPGYEISGFDALRRRLMSLTQNMRTRGNKQAVTAAGEEFAARLREVIASEAHDTGASERAVAVKTVAYPNGTAVAIIGIDRNHVEGDGDQRRRPANYWHLINYGTKDITPKRLLTKAYESGKEPAQAQLLAELSDVASKG